MKTRMRVVLLLPILSLILSCSDDAPVVSEPGADFIFGTAKGWFLPLLPGTESILEGTRSIISQGDSVLLKEFFAIHFRIEDRTLRSSNGWNVSVMHVRWIPADPDDMAEGDVYLRCTKDSVLFYSRSMRDEYAQAFLKTPFRVSEAWEYAEYTAEIQSVSDVVTCPAGLFSQAVKVTYTKSGAFFSVSFAKGVGPVRWFEKYNYVDGTRQIIDLTLKSKNFS